MIQIRCHLMPTVESSFLQAFIMSKLHKLLPSLFWHYPDVGTIVLYWDNCVSEILINAWCFLLWLLPKKADNPYLSFSCAYFISLLFFTIFLCIYSTCLFSWYLFPSAPVFFISVVYIVRETDACTEILQCHKMFYHRIAYTPLLPTIKFHVLQWYVF